MPSRLAQVTGSAEQKRGSIYQSSYDVRKLKESGILEGTRNGPSSCSSDALTLSIIDSLSQPSANESIQHSLQRKSPWVSLNGKQNLTSVGTDYIFANPGKIQFPSCLYHLSSQAENAECKSEEEKVVEPEKGGLVKDIRFRCSQVINPESNDNSYQERDIIHTPLKSFPTEVGMLELHCPLEFDRYKSSPKPCLSQQRQLLDPVPKTLPRRSPSSITAKEIGSARNKAIHRSLLHDFSKTSSRTECNRLPIRKESSEATTLSPAYLHGFLKLEHNHGLRFFKFSMTDNEDVLGAQIWRTDNAFNWVYTFHSLSGKMRSNSAKERHRPSSMIGQMQVSCYLCSEIRNGGSLCNSTITEFVSYDLAPMRRDFAAVQQISHCSPTSFRSIKDHVDLIGVSNPDNKTNTFASHPWGHMNLYPQLETVAVVIQVPFDKRESLKDKVEVKVGGREDVSISNFSAISKRSDTVYDRSSPLDVKVVTPSGTHGLPNTEGGPSPLLDRWRSGGGCDCGGWDTACPITIFSSPSVENTGHYPFMDNPQPFELFMQGAKEKMPALSITLISNGEYCVSFHAQLSVLQAFSICVALLHSMELPTADGHEEKIERLQCNSLKMLLDEEVRFLIEAVKNEEKTKTTSNTGENPPCFILDGPISPIGRV